MRSVEKASGPAGCPVLHHTHTAVFVCTGFEHRGMLATSFILLVAQQDLLKLTTTWQTSGGKRPLLLLPSVLMPFLIFTFTVIIVALIITRYRSSCVCVPLVHVCEAKLFLMICSVDTVAVMFFGLSPKTTGRLLANC